MFDTILDEFDEMEIDSFDVKRTSSKHIDYGQLDKYIDRAIFLEDNIIYLDEMEIEKDVLSFDTAELIEMFCYIYTDIKKALTDDEDIAEHIISFGINFKEKYLTYDSSLFEENSFEITKEILKERLDIIDKKSLLKDSIYDKYYEAIYTFLYGHPFFDGEEDIYWGIDNFAFVWEELCQSYAFKHYKNDILYADYKNEANLTLNGHTRMYAKEADKESYPFKVTYGDEVKYLYPDLVYQIPIFYYFGKESLWCPIEDTDGRANSKEIINNIKKILIKKKIKECYVIFRTGIDDYFKLTCPLVRFFVHDNEYKLEIIYRRSLIKYGKDFLKRDKFGVDLFLLLIQNQMNDVISNLKDNYLHTFVFNSKKEINTFVKDLALNGFEEDIKNLIFEQLLGKLDNYKQLQEEISRFIKELFIKELFIKEKEKCEVNNNCKEIEEHIEYIEKNSSKFRMIKFFYEEYFNDYKKITNDFYKKIIDTLDNDIIYDSVSKILENKRDKIYNETGRFILLEYYKNLDKKCKDEIKNDIDKTVNQDQFNLIKYFNDTFINNLFKIENINTDETIYNSKTVKPKKLIIKMNHNQAELGLVMTNLIDFKYKNEVDITNKDKIKNQFYQLCLDNLIKNMCILPKYSSNDSLEVIDDKDIKEKKGIKYIDKQEVAYWNTKILFKEYLDD
jgi:hypothetical protein